MNLFWATDKIGDGIGNAYGYSTHNRELRAAVAEQATLTTAAKDAVMICSPELFVPMPDYRTWLFTMFEGTTLPKKYVDNIAHADCLLTPSTWVKEMFSKYYPSERIFVVPHGVNKLFKYKKRHYPQGRKKFRFLWVGAPNPRKGYEEIGIVWDKVFAGTPEVELYIKTTRVEGKQRRGNVILDGRDLSLNRLVKLYHSAHCFVFPTRGEGFGLTLAEAMRTGLPCISTNYSGVTDFFDNYVGIPINYRMGRGVVTFVADGTEDDTSIAFPDIVELATAMRAIQMNYDTALLAGKRAHIRIKSQFTWEKSASILLDIIKRHPI